MYISVAYSRTQGFLKWCEAHQPSSDADKPDSAAPVAITEPPRDEHYAERRALGFVRVTAGECSA